MISRWRQQSNHGTTPHANQGKEAKLSDSNQENGRWHLDKRVPIALIVTIAMQTGAFIWWTATITQRVTTLELRSASRDQLPERIVRLETQYSNITEGISEIKQLLRSKSAP
jgi:hypothetical protein